MRIAHVIGAASGGGAEKQAGILCRELSRDGVEAVLICGRVGQDAEAGRSSYAVFLPERNKWSLISRVRDIFHALDAFQPELVHAWLPEVFSLPATVWAKRRGVPVVSSHRTMFRGHVVDKPRNALLFIQHLLSTRIVSNFDCSPEPFYFRSLLGAKLNTIWNAVDLETEGRGTTPLSISRLVTCGRFVKQKNMSNLVRAVRILHANGLEIPLVIYGDGAPGSRRSLNRVILREGMTSYVSCLGFVSDWASSLRPEDVFVLPSNYEGMPNALFEAMSMGCSCIASGVSGVRSLPGFDESVYLLEHNNPGSIADMITHVASAEDRAKRIKAGLQLVKSLDAPRMVDAYLSIYRELIELNS